MHKATNGTDRITLIAHLRQALSALYDPPKLGRNPLVARLGLATEANPASQLFDLLLREIEEMRPGATIPPQAKAWRIYRVLQYRYVELIPQNEIALSLTLSPRQLRRDEAEALELLADRLGCHLPVDDGDSMTDPKARMQAPQTDLPDSELEWLRTTFPNEAISVRRLVEGAVSTLAPLIETAQVRVTRHLPERIPRVAVHDIPMRQALVTVVDVAARCVPGGQVIIEAAESGAQVIVQVMPVSGRQRSQPLSPQSVESLEMARKLTLASGGSLNVLLQPEKFAPPQIVLSLPAAKQWAVLVVDDNVDTQQLFQRYLDGSRYAYFGVRDPERGLAMVVATEPRAVLLDVMLPGIDGWELLGRFREHPSTRHIPILVCTILPQEHLALALGASAFLRKPVRRDSLLRALDDVLLGPGQTNSATNGPMQIAYE